MTKFHERMRQLYEYQKDLNYKFRRIDFAEKLGVTRGRLDGWLDGNGEPGSEMLKKIADIMGVNVAWLIGATDLKGPLEQTEMESHILSKCRNLSQESLRSLEEYLEFLSYRESRKAFNGGEKILEENRRL